MTWPAPAPTLRPPPPDPADEPSVDATVAPARPSVFAAIAPAAWVAVVGGLLVLVAAALVVLSNWDAIGRGARAGGLVLATVGLLVIAERIRATVPTTASVIAHVGTFLTATAGIATMSALSFTWPACLAVGGLVAALATELQRRRGLDLIMGVGQVAGIALASTGVATLTGTTAGVVAAVMATVLVTTGSTWRTSALALLAVCSPALTALADAGIGTGTFERAGLVGERLGWSGPTVGVIAAAVLLTAARRRSNNALVVCGLMAPVIGAVTGLASIDGSQLAWYCLPAFVVVAAELTWWLLPSDAGRRPIEVGVDLLAGSLAVVAVLTAPTLGNDLVSAAVPLAVTLLALALSQLRWRTDERAIGDLGIAAVAAVIVGLVAAIDAGAVVTASAAVLATAGAAWASRRLHAAAILVPAAWALVSIAAIEIDGRWAVGATACALIGATAAIVVFTRGRLAGAAGLTGPMEMLTVTGAVAFTTGLAVPEQHGVAALIAAVAVVGAYLAVDRRFERWAVVALGMAAAPIAFVASWNDNEDWLWVGATLAIVPFLAAALGRRSAFAAGAASSLAVVAAATTMVPLPVSVIDFLVLAMIASVALTGLAVTFGPHPPLLAASLTAGGLLFVVAFLAAEPAWSSAGWTMLGIQLVVIGLLLGRLSVAASGLLIATVGMVSWWFTSGWHDAVSEWLEPADIRGGDLWMAAASSVVLSAGLAARRASDTPSWLAYGPAIIVAGLWLVPVIEGRETVWALPIALAVGLAAVAIGAARRLLGPLVGGVFLTGAAVFVALGADVGLVPAWAWFAFGGVAMLAIAVVVERISRDDTTLGELVDSWD